jgi:hypothetical protein
MKETLLDIGTHALFDAARDEIVCWKRKADGPLNERCATAGICAGAYRVPITTEVTLTRDDRETIMKSAKRLSPWINDNDTLEWRSLQ